MKTHEPDKQSCERTDERGSALILTLGVLALLLISATVFVFTANIEREAAAVNADMTKARLMAKSKLEQAMALIYRASFYNQMSSYFTYGRDNWQGSYHMASAWSTAYQDDLPEALTAFLGFEFLPGTLAGLDCHLAGATVAPSWQLITGPEPPGEDLNSNGSIDNDLVIGRAAYLVMMEPDIDPYATTAIAEPYQDLDLDGSYDAATEYLYDWNSDGNQDTAGTGTTLETYKDAYNTRVGYTVNEIYSAHRFYVGDPSDADGNMGHSSTDLNAFREFVDDIQNHGNVATTAGQDRWLDWRHIQGRTSLTTAQLEKHARGFAGNTRYTPQAYTEGATKYQRFSLSGFDWDSPTWGATPAARVTYIQDYSANRRVWDGAVSTEAIEWLDTLVSQTDFDGGGVGSSDHDILQDQVAANLIDYSDSDSNATTDFAVSGTHGDESSGTFCGLEKVPYVNEVVATVTVSGGAAPHSIYIKLDIELVNIYSVDLTAGAVDCYVRLSSLPDGATANSTDAAVVAEDGDGFDMQWTGVTVTDAAGYAAGYAVVSGTATYDAIPALGSSFNIEIVVTVSTEAGGAVQDAAMLPIQTVPSTAGAYLREWYVDDPRCNLQRIFWTTGSGPGTLDPLNPRNPNSDPSAAGANRDNETVTDPAGSGAGDTEMSTAFVPDRPMVTLWELGAIHRGEPWRTINLRAVGAAPTGSYADGDAKLLSQCCIESEKLQPGKISANSSNRHTWYALFRGLHTGDDYTFSGGVPINLVDIISGSRVNDNNDMIDFVLDANGSDSGSGAPFDERWRIATVDELSDGTFVTQDTDRAQEEIIGKTANLLTTDLDARFRVFVVVQVLKDIRGIPSAVPDQDSWIYYTPSKRAELLAESKLMALVSLDRDNQTLKIEKWSFVE